MGDRPKHPGGRPKNGEYPLTVDCKVRFDAPTALLLDNYCARHDTNRAAAIRSAVQQMLDADTGNGTQKK